jgi:hypothetical protein
MNYSYQNLLIMKFIKFIVALLGLLLIMGNFYQFPDVINNIMTANYSSANGIASVIGSIIGFLLIIAIGLLMMWFGLWRKSKT